jgi:hypothetical protein
MPTCFRGVIPSFTIKRLIGSAFPLDIAEPLVCCMLPTMLSPFLSRLILMSPSESYRRPKAKRQRKDHIGGSEKASELRLFDSKCSWSQPNDCSGLSMMQSKDNLAISCWLIHEIWSSNGSHAKHDREFDEVLRYAI